MGKKENKRDKKAEKALREGVTYRTEGGKLAGRRVPVVETIKTQEERDNAPKSRWERKGGNS